MTFSESAPFVYVRCSPFTNPYSVAAAAAFAVVPACADAKADDGVEDQPASISGKIPWAFAGGAESAGRAVRNRASINNSIARRMNTSGIGCENSTWGSRRTLVPFRLDDC